jgi:hypothetical protein
MPLTAEGLEWVRAHLDVAATAEDLDRPYVFNHELNATRQIDDWQIEETSMAWGGNFWNAEGQETLTARLSREVLLEFELRKAERGAIAMHHSCRVRVSRKGFGGALHRGELDLYARWGVVEVHLHAVDDGLVVWPRMGFQPYSLGWVVEAWDLWASERGLDPTPKANMTDYPEDFLRSLGYVHMFKVVQ